MDIEHIKPMERYNSMSLKCTQDNLQYAYVAFADFNNRFEKEHLDIKGNEKEHLDIQEPYQSVQLYSG